ncbi:hypothetical protein [Roseateles sp. L2-2]|uniref:hypothetical protein n=1 Tax=Roseateles TaxID=93681 RepID=UPI003D36441C
MRAVLLLIVIAVLGVVGWKKRDEIPFLRDAAREVQRQAEKVEVPKNPFDNEPPPPATSGGPQSKTPTGAPRRCVVNGSTLYTNEACPEGSTEQKIKGGTITVYKAPPTPAAPGSASSGIPNARELLAPKGPTLKQQAQDKIIEGL